MAFFTRSLPALVGAALFLLAACDSPAEREAEHLARGKQLLESGDAVKAALEFRNALQINPVGAEATYSLALIAERQGDYQAALRGYRAVADQNAGNIDAQLKTGQLELFFGDPASAAFRAGKAIELAPDRIDGHVLKAGALRLQGKLDQADSELMAALKIAPDNADALGILAEIRLQQDRFDDALQLVDRGLAAEPDNTNLLTFRLTLMRERKDGVESLAIMKRLVEVAPGNADYLGDLGEALADSGKIDDAKALFETAIRSQPQGEQLVARYVAFLEKHIGVDRAFDAIKPLTEGASSNPRHRLLLAQLSIHADQLENAEAILKEIEKQPASISDGHEAQIGLAQIALLRSDRAAAQAMVQAVLQQDQHNEGALFLRGGLLMEEQKFDAVIADARMILHGNPESRPALSLLSRAYMATGDKELAAQTLRTLLQLDPSDVQAHLDMASLLAPRSPIEAIKELDAAIALRPNSSEVLAQKALYLIQLGRPDMAELIGRDIVKADAKDARGHQVLGDAALARKDDTIAVGAYVTALENGGDFSILGPKIVQAYVDAGKPAEGEAYLNTRLATAPTDGTALVLLASLQQRDGDLTQAMVLLDRAIAAQPDSATPYLSKAQLLVTQGQIADAAQTLRAATERLPGNLDIALSLAAAEDGAGNSDAARTAYEAILKKWPSNLVAINNLATLIADGWQTDTALLGRARALAERFRHSGNATQIDTLGWVLFRQGEVDDALALLAKATALDPQDQSILYHYGAALKAKGLDDKARQALKAALLGQPNYRGVDDARKLAGELM